MPANEVTDVYRSENIVARAIACDDVSRWVITFDNYSIGHGFEREGFSEGFLKEKGLSAIHIMGRREDWYQYPDMKDAIDAIRKHLPHPERIITYGSSMGGYAALRFADLLRVDAVLALSPQYSINPKKVPFETRWLQDANRIVWRPELEPPLPKTAHVVVVYDPTTIDAQHVDLIASEVPTTTIPVRYSGHPSGPVVADTHLLAPLLLDVLNGVEDLSYYSKAVRTARKHSSTYLIHLARALPARKSHIALALAERAVSLQPLHVDSLRYLADNLVIAGRHEEAMTYYKRAVDAAQGSIAGLIPFADGLARMGRSQEALTIVRDVIVRPDAAVLAHLHAWHGMIAWQAGQFQEASRAVNRALALHPDEPKYHQLASAYKIDTSIAARFRRALARKRLKFSPNEGSA